MKPGSMLRFSFWLKNAMSLAKVSRCITIEYLLGIVTINEDIQSYTFAGKGCSL